jgi:hypothetical protein
VEVAGEILLERMQDDAAETRVISSTSLLYSDFPTNLPLRSESFHNHVVALQADSFL